MDFETRQLRYFAEAAQLGSMSQAAKRLDVSQQALSKGISALEGSLGERLLVRDRSGVAPTGFGRFFLRRAQEVLDAADALGASLGDYRSQTPRTITLGVTPRCISDFGGTLNARRLNALNEACQGATFEFKEVPGDDLERMLRCGTLQFGICAAPEDESFESRLLANFPLVVLVSRENPLCGHAAISPADLATGTVALASSDNLKPLLSRLEQQAGRAIPVSPIQIDPVDASELVVNPSTFVIRPEQHARRTTSTGRVALVPLADAQGQPVSVPLSIVWKRALPIGRPERLLIDYICGLYANRSRDDR